MVSNYAASSVNILVLQIATSCFYSVLRMEIMGIVSIIAQEIRVRQKKMYIYIYTHTQRYIYIYVKFPVRINLQLSLYKQKIWIDMNLISFSSFSYSE